MKIYRKYQPLFEFGPKRKYDIYVFTGGRGSFKTGTSVRAILSEMTQRRLRVVCFRETQRTQKSSLIVEFQELINSEFKNRGFCYNSETVSHKNGSIVTFLGLKDSNINAREAIKGIGQVDIWFIDEGQAVSYGVWRVLLETARKEGAKIIICYNRTEEDLPVEEALFLDYENKTAPERIYFAEINYPEVAHLGLLSNIFLQTAENLKKFKPDEYMQDYLNKPRGGFKAKVVKYWGGDNINPDIRYVEDLDIYWSLDFNVNPAMSVLAHYDGRKFYFFDEIVINNCITQDVVDEFMQRYPPDKVKGVVQVCGDASGSYRKTQSKYTDYAIITNSLAKNGYRSRLNVRRANPPIMARVNAFNRQVFNDAGERLVLVHPRCEKLIYNMRNLKFKEGTSIIDAPTPSQIAQDDNKLYLGHIFDAASYLVEYFKPVVREW